MNDLRQKIWKALAPAGKDLECVIGIDDSEAGVHVWMTNHRTGSAFGLTMRLDDYPGFIVRTVVGAVKAAWPHLTENIRWEDVQ